MNCLHSLVFLAYVYYFNSVGNCIKNSNHDIWWGPEDMRYKTNDSVRPFRIEFDVEMIHDLKHRLKYHRPSKPTFPNVGFEYGFNTRELSKWTDYWAEYYPFMEREDFLNRYPQYKTNIQGLDIHFIWISPRVAPGIEVVPLLLLHGWPGSVREFYEAIPHLTAINDYGDRDFAVELVVPSLPGFGFSDAAVCPGLSTRHIAPIFKNLMHRLGHTQFYVQGGDWGSFIGADMATMYPEAILGYHTNLALAFTSEAAPLMLLGDINPSLVDNPVLASRLYPLNDTLRGVLRETGYFHLLATKPDTIGIALSDSPAGLLSFILQIFSTATKLPDIAKENGGLDRYHPVKLIDNLMYYWASNSITTSFRIYTETANKEFSLEVFSKPTYVPTWAVQTRYEIFYQPSLILRTKFRNLLHTTVLDEGGHFLALEMPKVFADDVLTALAAFRRWHRKNGK